MRSDMHFCSCIITPWQHHLFLFHSKLLKQSFDLVADLIGAGKVEKRNRKCKAVFNIILFYVLWCCLEQLQIIIRTFLVLNYKPLKSVMAENKMLFHIFWGDQGEWHDKRVICRSENNFHVIGCHPRVFVLDLVLASKPSKNGLRLTQVHGGLVRSIALPAALNIFNKG